MRFDAAAGPVLRPAGRHVIFRQRMRIRKETDNLNTEDIMLVAKCSDALGHPARVEIFQHIYSENLQRRTVCNRDLVERFGLAQATVSQHMNKLTGSGLITAQQQGTKNCYYVNLGLLGHYVNSIRKLNKPLAGRDDNA